MYTLGISPCPNDTFIFEALLHKRIAVPFQIKAHMADVEELNSLARRGELDITKLSVGVLPYVLDRYRIVNTGAALGRGCGPLLVSRPGLDPAQYPTGRIVTPGRLTTANLLLSLHGGFAGPKTHLLFDQVMPALQRGEADLGLIIHEGRFTYALHGLELVRDMGQWWEERSGLPLPLGVIAVRRDLGLDFALAVQEAIAASLAYAKRHPEQGLAFISAHAQEMDSKVMAAHIATFVNEFSENLGDEGRGAITSLVEATCKETDLPFPDQPIFVEN
ncbi:1,4-dihydroxy-6-naphthoate synthase [Desulfovibrio sp. OttesenSCG-928-M16]|nr:1,4-dihydroxy-6-naphthoate synthase [Desulfovibrio sp. OttesenSCG-928-M16]